VALAWMRCPSQPSIRTAERGTDSTMSLRPAATLYGWGCGGAAACRMPVTQAKAAMVKSFAVVMVQIGVLA
jgi:hypothetical protein